MDKNERERFEMWRKWWALTAGAEQAAQTPGVPTMLERDDAEPRPPLHSRRGIYHVEEMHVRDALGMPLGELRVKSLDVDGRRQYYMDLEFEPGMGLR